MGNMQEIAAALQRVETVLQRKPEAGLHDDAPATARWAGGTRVVATHANGTELQTDMPAELGGSGDRVTPGWLFRAGLAGCGATTIALRAAAEGIALDALEVRASSRSDTRGLLGLADADGAPVPAGPCDLRLHVRIAAAGVAPERLRTLVQSALRCAPISGVVASANDVALDIDTGAA